VVTGPPDHVGAAGGDPSGATDPAVRYATQVVAVGPIVADFCAQGVLVFFGELAPPELHEFVLLHRPHVVGSAPVPGDVIELDGEPFTITAVGDVVEENLLRLGHFALKTDGSATAPLPGDVCVEVKPLPLLAAGGTMRILAAAEVHQAEPHEGGPATTEEPS
jgi:PTS system glucitol/sorbitol-specific IIA component